MNQDNDSTFYSNAATMVIDARNAMRDIEACGAIRYIDAEDYAEAVDFYRAARLFLATGQYYDPYDLENRPMDIWATFGDK